VRPPTPPRRTAPVGAPRRPTPPRRPAEVPAAKAPAPAPVPAPRPAPAEDAVDRPVVVAPAERWVPQPRPTVLASAERFAERARLQRRLTLRRIAWAASGVVVAAALGWLAFVSPVLALDLAEVEVVGQGTVVDPSAVLGVVAEHDGTPLPRLDTVELRRDVLDVPGVRAAEVSRVWPHGLRIELVSREPVAAVPDAEGFLLLDMEGVQVGRAAEPPAGLPVITVPVDDPDARAMTAVLAVLERLPVELADQVVAASAESEDTVRLTLADGALVEWGSADQSALKARVLLTLRASPASAGASVFDVSAPTLPITRT